MIKEIYFIRHAETDWNKKHLAQGSRNDIPINETGKNQAHITGKYLFEQRMNSGSFDLILSSPMSRTRKTAKIIAKEINYQNKIKYLDELIELDFGLLAQGISEEELKNDPFYDDYFRLLKEYNDKNRIERLEIEFEEFPELMINKYKIESLESIMNRINYIINFLRNTKCKKIIVVSHNSILQWLNKFILNTSENIKGDLSNGKNCYITYYIMMDSNFRLIMAPSTTHLQDYTS